MNARIGRMMLLGVAALVGSSGALAYGDCGINSKAPCPPAKSSAKEPAYKSLNSNAPAAPQQASLSGISASDLKMPPKGDCGMNSNTPCADEGQAAAPARVQAGGDAGAASKASLSGINPNDLKLKPKPTSTFEKEPATKP